VSAAVCVHDARAVQLCEACEPVEPDAAAGAGDYGETECEFKRDPSVIRLDPEFRDLLPPPAPEEQTLSAELLFRPGHRATFYLWYRPGGFILLTGYDRFELVRDRGLPFAVIVKQFETREHARLFIIKDCLARRHLSDLAVRYLRGLRYQASCRPRGGDHKSTGALPGLGKTAEALAEIFGVSPATIRRDARLTAAVQRIAENCGRQARWLLLARGARLRRAGVLRLAGLPLAQQQAVIQALADRGRLPRSWAGEPRTITLPRERQAFAEGVWRRLGAEAAHEIGRLLAAKAGQTEK
jgi:hypothetical protein